MTSSTNTHDDADDGHMTLRITYEGDSVIMRTRWIAQAGIVVDGLGTGFVVADGRGSLASIVRLVADREWGTVYETAEDVPPGRAVGTYCVWDDVAYERKR